jgi:hypothetical protein
MLPESSMINTATVQEQFDSTSDSIYVLHERSMNDAADTSQTITRTVNCETNGINDLT